MEPRCRVAFNQVILVLVSYIEYINILWPFADTVIVHHSTINLVCIFAEKTLYDFPQQLNNTYLKETVDFITSQLGFNTLKYEMRNIWI